MFVLTGIVAFILFLEFSMYNEFVMSFVGAILYSAPIALLGIIVFYWASKIELTITNKRVYGVAAFGKRVDLPLDSISAVGISIFRSIANTTASGSIKFVWIKNRDEIYNEISKLLIHRQDKVVNVSEVNKNTNVVSNANELRAYKELLDSGVITQDEFEAKKKQLLDL